MLWQRETDKIKILDGNPRADRMWHVMETLEAAVWSFMNVYDYRFFMQKAVNLGGYTDTLSGVMGSSAGM
jgi:ADP-ribosylglycohydrolase